MTPRKIMLLGDIGVGKSSIVQRLVFDRFDMAYKPTIGVDVYRYEVPEAAGRPAMTFIVWDTDGNLSDLMFRHVYMKAASAAMIVGDLTRRATLETMLRLGRGFSDELPGRHISFVLNKRDLLSTPEAADIPKDLKGSRTDVAWTSALTGENVREAFVEAANGIYRRGY
jgi:small GTP-binding protein